MGCGIRKGGDDGSGGGGRCCCCCWRRSGGGAGSGSGIDVACDDEGWIRLHEVGENGNSINDA